MSNQPGNSAEGTQTGVVPEQVQPLQDKSESDPVASPAGLKTLFDRRRNGSNDNKSVTDLLRASHTQQWPTKVQ